MKRFMFLVCAALIVFISCPAAVQAAFVQPGLDPARFWVVDDNSTSDDDQVTLSVDNIGVLGSGDTLEYSLDNSTWNTVTGDSLTVATGVDDWELVYFRLALGAGGYDTSADLSFLAPDGELFNSVMLNWGTFELTIFVAGDNDNVAPVPVPAAFWLFGSGLIGLLGLRRRLKS